MQRLEVDQLGLDNIDRRMLTAIITNYGGSLPHAVRKVAGERFIRNAANAVGAKQFSHDFDSSSQKDLKFCRKVVCIYRLSCSGTSSMLFGTERRRSRT